MSRGRVRRQTLPLSKNNNPRGRAGAHRDRSLRLDARGGVERQQLLQQVQSVRVAHTTLHAVLLEAGVGGESLCYATTQSRLVVWICGAAGHRLLRGLPHDVEYLLQLVGLVLP